MTFLLGIPFVLANEIKPALKTERIKFEGIWVESETMTQRLYKMSGIENVKTSCENEDHGGIPGSWISRDSAFFRWDGQKSTTAVLSATCTMGKVGFVNHYWTYLITEDSVTEINLPKLQEFWVTRNGFLGAEYKDSFRGAPSVCDYKHFTWTFDKLVLDKEWTSKAKGEFHFATCEPFEG